MQAIRIATTATFILLLLNSVNVFSQTLSEQDSSKQKVLLITPNQIETNVNAIASSFYLVTDSIAFHTYAGLNVLNTLRGNVPNTIFDANLMNRGAELLQTLQPLIIDGIAYTSDIGDFYNLNAFEFKKIYAINSGAAALSYGYATWNGGIFLESKDGKDLTKPLIEFNSYSTYGWETPRNYTRVGYVQPQDAHTINHFSFGNSIAYAQDFGAVDTRVSYNYTFDPNDNFVMQSRKGNHNLKINTGFDIGKKFTARIIFDQFFQKQMSNDRIQTSSSLYSDKLEIINRNTQGNLTLRFQPLSWLTFTSQSTIGRTEYSSPEQETSANETMRRDQRWLANIFATAAKNISERIGINAFAGFQKINHDYLITGSYEYLANGDYDQSALFAGAGFHYNNSVFVNLNFRKSEPDPLPPTWSHAINSAYSISGTWVFSNTFKNSSAIVSMGKFRMLLGTQPFNQIYEYPLTVNPNFGTYDAAQSTFEFGTDLGLLNDRIFLSHTARLSQQFLSFSNSNEFKTTTFEAILGGVPVKSNRLHWTTKLIWGTYETVVRTGSFYAAQSPDWRMSLSNQFDFNKVFIRLLLDGVGGDYYHTEYFDLSYNSETQFRLRELSIGYHWATSSGNRGMLSLSGRNLFKIYSESDDNIDGYNSGYTGRALRSISVSLSLMF